MKKEWSYKGFQIEAGLKPGSKKFQYFYLVSEGGKKRCNYCVWIEDEALSGFDEAGGFEAIISSQEGNWEKWVQDKIDQDDFRNMVLKFDREGQSELDLAEMKDKLTMD